MVEATCFADPEFRKQEFADFVGFFKMGVAGGDDGLDSERLIFAQARRDRLGVADQRRAGAATDQADSGREVGREISRRSRRPPRCSAVICR